MTTAWSFPIPSPPCGLTQWCASVFRLSRGAAAEAVGRGLVAVNGSEASKPDAQVTEGDKISLRGKGRAVIGKTAGTSKKGRIRFEYKKYR